MKLFLYLALSATVLLASDPWTKNSQNWTNDDAQRVLNSSPWAQTTKATLTADEEDREPPPPGPLPGAAQAGMAGPRGATDGHWDGGVGRMRRGSPPTLPILIRWDSALPVREAAERTPEANVALNNAAAKDYIISLFGLVPASRFRDAGELDGKSASDDAVDARDPEELLEGLMTTSRLIRRGHPALAPENVKLDGATGVVHLFFPRTDPIGVQEKEIVFRTRFGALTVERVFRLRDMVYNGNLEL